MPRTSTKPLRTACMVGYFVTAAAIIAVPMLLVPAANRSPHFWQRILWVEFLAILFWVFFAGFFWIVFPRTHSRAGLGGIVPSAGTTVISYAMISGALVIFVPDPSVGWHLAIQAALLAAMVLTFVGFEFARFGAVAGTEPLSASLRTPPELCTMIQRNEDRLQQSEADRPAEESQALRQALKALRESIQYSIQHIGRMDDYADYRQFAADVESLCTDLRNIGSVDASNFLRRTDDLRSRITALASATKVHAM